MTFFARLLLFKVVYHFELLFAQCQTCFGLRSFVL